jgi:hypothetical protein
VEKEIEQWLKNPIIPSEIGQTLASQSALWAYPQNKAPTTASGQNFSGFTFKQETWEQEDLVIK